MPHDHTHPAGRREAPDAALPPANSPLRMSGAARLVAVSVPVAILWILVGFATDVWP